MGLYLTSVEVDVEQNEYRDAWCGPEHSILRQQVKSVTLQLAGTDGELREFLAIAQAKLQAGRELTVTLDEETT